MLRGALDLHFIRHFVHIISFRHAFTLIEAASFAMQEKHFVRHVHTKTYISHSWHPRLIESTSSFKLVAGFLVASDSIVRMIDRIFKHADLKLRVRLL